MDYYENVVLHYLRADRAMFMNSECCIQINQNDNPDISGPHWYCDAVAADLRNKTIFLCEVSYSHGLQSLAKRLTEWHENWDKVCLALGRDSFLNSDWPIRPWLFVPERLVHSLLNRFDMIKGEKPLRYTPRITPLENIQPWLFPSWNRTGELPKPSIIPEEMRS
jgi:hypothetical protein